jgi:hypothetical protein
MAVVAVATGFVIVEAQDSAPPRPAGAQAKPTKPLVPLKVTVVIARFQGQKRTGNLPFEMIVNADGDQSILQMGADVPYAQTAFIPGKDGAPNPAQVSYTFRSIGTNITCTARASDDGRFSVSLSLRDSQIFTDPLPGVSNPVPGAPTFQSFTSNAQLLLRDGQTVQYNTAVDKASGEQIKVDVTLNVIK